MRTISFKIEETLLATLDMIASQKGFNRSEAIRYAIEKMIKEELEKEPLHIKIEKMKI